MPFCKRIDAQGYSMTEFEEVQGLSQQTKLVYNFKQKHDFYRGLNREDSSDTTSQKMPGSE
jgi:hypothetical protein